MSVVKEGPDQQEHLPSISVPLLWWRPFVLGILLLLALTINVYFLVMPPQPTHPRIPFMLFYIAGFVPYLAACILVLKTKPQEPRWLELGLIFTGALLLRTMVLSVEPFLSPDSWRYLWDARITLLGYSPYVYKPEDPLFVHLRDVIYQNTAYRYVPTIYPPGAQAIYLLSYLLAPGNLVVLKGIFVLMDTVTCVALAYFLKYRGLDPRRVIIYAWCPVPIIEIAIEGHLDAIAIMFSMLAIVCNCRSGRGSRALTGFLIGMATLAKLYPIILLLVVWRRRDWLLLAVCGITIFLGYLPYIILGHGQALGFFSIYVNQHQFNAGPVQHVMTSLRLLLGFDNATQFRIEYIIDAVLVGATALAVLVLRLREQIRVEVAILVLIGIIFFVSSHIFPWYPAALLPWIAVLVQPLWTRQQGWSASSLAVASAWYFTCTIILHYFFDRLPDWSLYYLIVYDVVLTGLAVAALVSLVQWRRRKRVHNIVSRFKQQRGCQGRPAPGLGSGPVPRFPPIPTAEGGARSNEV